MFDPIRFRLPVACLATLLALAGCTSQAPAPATPTPASAEVATASQAPEGKPENAARPTVPAAGPATLPKAPRMSDPLPAEAMPSPVTIDYSCRADADCAVKDVGNCCGRMPACVNKNSPTDPAAVQAECKRNGVSSTCGFREIASCSCVNSRCTGQQGTGAATE